MTIDNLPALRDASLAGRIEYAEQLAYSNLLPAQYRKQPANILFAIEFGDALGIKPIIAMNGVHVIEGKPSASSGLISALVRDAGHRLRVWVERDPQGAVAKAVATIVRKDDPDFEFRAEWTWARAQAAGLAGKAVWRNYPEAMLKARATTEVAREACEEALLGVGYTPEELGAEVTGDGSVVITSAPQRPNQPGQTIREAVAQAAPSAAAAPIQPETAERMISAPQQKKMGALMREAGITDRDAALAFVADVIGRTVASRNELTLDEAGKVIDTLEAVQAAPTPAGEEPVDAEIVEPAEAEQLMSLIVGEWEQRGGTKDELTGAFQKAMSVGHREATESELQSFLDQLRDGKHQPKAARTTAVQASVEGPAF